MDEEIPRPTSRPSSSQGRVVQRPVPTISLLQTLSQSKLAVSSLAPSSSSPRIGVGSGVRTGGFHHIHSGAGGGPLDVLRNRRNLRPVPQVTPRNLEEGKEEKKRSMKFRHQVVMGMNVFQSIRGGGAAPW